MVVTLMSKIYAMQMFYVQNIINITSTQVMKSGDCKFSYVEK